METAAVIHTHAFCGVIFKWTLHLLSLCQPFGSSHQNIFEAHTNSNIHCEIFEFCRGLQLLES